MLYYKSIDNKECTHYFEIGKLTQFERVFGKNYGKTLTSITKQFESVLDTSWIEL